MRSIVIAHKGHLAVRLALTRVGRPDDAARALISESGRKRDTVASMASSSASTAPRATARATGSVTTIYMLVLHRRHWVVAVCAICSAATVMNRGTW
ncbi:MAG TPA: hypothetical protein VKA77_01835 [Mycobacterium sp.]|nr:hypothetical protein [Mycobacterium sp.]